MESSFFTRLSDTTFRSTSATRGPWSPDSQHAGPPSALLGRAISDVDGRDDMQVARITFEILKPVPVTELDVTAELVRPGKSVELVEATLKADGGTVMRARAWRIRKADLKLEPIVTDTPPPPLPKEDADAALFNFGYFGYLDAMEWRAVKGGFTVPGPATVWARMRVPLIEGDATRALDRVLVLADSGNGISATLDWSRWVFINPDLSVYLYRLPEGEWVCLDAATTVEPSGIGMAASVLSDETGPIGRGMQSLFISSR
jgi:Thioesterase-like superfamily